jgi:hypothetical protein
MTFKAVSDVITFNGHPNILGTHPNTLEVTMDEDISRRADCIIGVRADKSCLTLNSALRKQIRSGCGLRFLLIVRDIEFEFIGFGSSNLTLEDEKEIVLRISDYASPRTLAIRCTAAASDIPRDMIELLRYPTQFGSLKIESTNNRFNEEVPWGLLTQINNSKD